MSNVKTLAIDLIQADTETQTRASLNTEHVADLRAVWEHNGVTLPPVVVYFDGTIHWLSDGFHRVQSAKEAKRGSIQAEVREGTKRDALHAALAANKGHGLRRTNEDKRLAVTKMLADAEWGKWSDERIAEHVGVTRQFVGTVRKPPGGATVASPSGGVKVEKRVGRDGKVYEVKKPPKVEKPKQFKDEFDTAKLDKELAADKKKRNGRVAGFEEKRVNDFVRKLVQLIDDQFDALEALCEEREAAMGGDSKLYNSAKGAMKSGRSKAHDGVNAALVAIDKWRGK